MKKLWKQLVVSIVAMLAGIGLALVNVAILRYVGIGVFVLGFLLFLYIYWIKLDLGW
jgi:hypothetical protein